MSSIVGAKTAELAVKSLNFGANNGKVGVKSTKAGAKSTKVEVICFKNGANNGKDGAKSRKVEAKNTKVAAFCFNKLTGRIFIAAAVFFGVAFESVTEKRDEIIEVCASAVVFGVAVNVESSHY